MLNFNEKSVLPNDRDLWGRGQDRSESKALNKEGVALRAHAG